MYCGQRVFKMVDICICDDQKTITDYLKFFILKNFEGDFNIVTFNSYRDAYNKIVMCQIYPDILITDINLGDGNGIELVNIIQCEHPMLKAIFLTGFIDYATEIFETNPSYFLTKPINENKLTNAIKKVLKNLQFEKNKSVTVKSNGSESVILYKNIVFIESSGRKLTIHTCEEKDISLYEKMDDLQKRLDKSFVRCHKSFLVNMKYIVERTNQSFVLTDGRHIPISKSNFKEVKSKFISYLGDSQWD